MFWTFPMWIAAAAGGWGTDGLVAAPAPPVRHVSPLSESAIEEILEIRRRGGSLLEGTIFGPGGEFGSTDEAFARMLRQVAAEAAGDGASRNRPAATSLPSRAAPRELSHVESEADVELLQTIEGTIELLHAKIGRLERMGRYDLSDQLQRTVRQLRLSARAIRAGAATADRSVRE